MFTSDRCLIKYLGNSIKEGKLPIKALWGHWESLFFFARNLSSFRRSNTCRLRRGPSFFNCFSSALAVCCHKRLQVRQGICCLSIVDICCDACFLPCGIPSRRKCGRFRHVFLQTYCSLGAKRLLDASGRGAFFVGASCARECFRA